MKNFRSGLLMAIALVSVFSAAAVAAEKNNPGDSVVPVEIKFAGLINQQPVFQLVFDGTSPQDEYTISIQDELGTTLYRERAKGNQFSRSFLLNTDELGDQNLRFNIYSSQTKQSVSYEVNRNSRFVQDIAIRKF